MNLSIFIPIIILAGEIIQHTLVIALIGSTVVEYFAQKQSLNEGNKPKTTVKKDLFGKNNRHDLLILLLMVLITGFWRIAEYFSGFFNPFYQVFTNLPAIFFVVFFARHLVGYHVKNFPKKVYFALFGSLLVNFLIDSVYVFMPTLGVHLLESLVQTAQIFILYFFVLNYILITCKSKNTIC